MRITSSAPMRIGLFGGGTDVEPYASTYGGICLNMAINLRQKFEYDNDVNFKDGTVTRVLGPDSFHEAFLGEKGYRLIQECDAPLNSGLGSSAAAAVALLGVMNKERGIPLLRSVIAEKAWELENNGLKLFGGKQDQYAASYGGVNGMEFSSKGVGVEPLPKRFVEALEPHMMLFFVGHTRRNSKIQEGMKSLDGDQINALNNLKDLAVKGIQAIGYGEIEKAGELLDQSWMFKKKSNNGVTTTKIDKLYQLAKKKGVWGGKLCGSGGGGHVFFIAPVGKQEKIIKALEKQGAKHIDFSIDWNGLEVRKL